MLNPVVLLHRLPPCFSIETNNVQKPEASVEENPNQITVKKELSETCSVPNSPSSLWDNLERVIPTVSQHQSQNEKTDVKLCAVTGCKNTNLNHSFVLKFPRDEAVKKKWLHNSGLSKYVHGESNFICNVHAHFGKDWINSCIKRSNSSSTADSSQCKSDTSETKFEQPEASKKNNLISSTLESGSSTQNFDFSGGNSYLLQINRSQLESCNMYCKPFHTGEDDHLISDVPTVPQSTIANNIRNGEVNDCYELARLIKQSTSDLEKNSLNLTSEDLKMYGFKNYPPAFLSIVVEHKYHERNPENLIGYAIYRYSHSIFEGKYMVLDDIFVHPDYRRKGIGTNLFCFLCRVAVKDLCKSIVFHMPSSKSKALKFFENFGINATSVGARLEESQLKNIYTAQNI